MIVYYRTITDIIYRMSQKIIFSLSNSKAFAEEVSKLSGIALGDIETKHFSDGELIVRCLNDVAGKTAIIIQSTSVPSAQSLFEIELLADALQEGGAKKIIAVLPYYGCCRQDRISYTGEPISSRVVAKMLEAVGITKVYTIDLHTEEILKYFTKEIVNLKPFEIYAGYFKNKIDVKNLVVITPDHGSDDRAEALAKYFPGCTSGFFTKSRPADNQSEVLSFTGDVNGKTCLIIDDIIDTCGTINHAIDVLKAKNAKEIYVVGTHSIFSTTNRVQNAKEVVVSNTIEKSIEGVQVVSVSKLVADALLKD